ncbi:MAG: hypothetical protein ALECFALPRED_006940 [Alectoria fallacina]|uniref:Nudix hydrolase domain-containing protein n=1 Tax=Alectoria fallacina TaxID=1903189 RepID=A0A8H3I145_9LECA|nr:MAG: hypothetical protein ALECFALPRED_006940 [Alectoria fallacina]
MAQKLASTARTGRDNQREFNLKFHSRPSARRFPKQAQCGYGPHGERLVAGVVPLSSDKKKVLLIQSTRRGGWVLPKGGWETDEGTAEEAACREAWEEAGIECKIQRDLGKIPDKRSPEQLTAHAPKAIFQFYEVSVEKEATQWPEKHKRGRQWMSYQEAKDALATRPELLDALNKSSIVR